jgi:ElaB/YqjD/DUF883 family membrane-anchored ribosome-binding protein
MDTTGEEGALPEVAGDVQQTAGNLPGDTSAHVSGTAKELSRNAQQLYADCAELIRASAVERPFSALAIAAGVGFILGALHAASRRQPNYVRADAERE